MNANLHSSFTDAEQELTFSSFQCEKLRKKRSSLIGAFISTHGKSIDDVDKSIMDARYLTFVKLFIRCYFSFHNRGLFFLRTALSEVTTELQERIYRWHQIEQICGFPIVNNKGLSHLEEKLYKNSIKFKGKYRNRCFREVDNSN